MFLLLAGSTNKKQENERKEMRFINKLVRKLLGDSPVGIDVSNWQGWIDWWQVANAGITFAYMKATEADNFVDGYFAGNWQRSRDAGIMRGAYHYFRPQVSVQAQIDNFCGAVGQWQQGDLQPMLDLEDPADWQSVPFEQRTNIVLAWLNGVWFRLGAQPVIYASPSFIDEVLGNDPRLKDFPLWVAHYTMRAHPTVPAPWEFWTFWQHASNGRVPGVDGNVDVDRFNGSLGQLQKFQYGHQGFWRRAWTSVTAWVPGRS